MRIADTVNAQPPKLRAANGQRNDILRGLCNIFDLDVAFVSAFEGSSRRVVSLVERRQLFDEPIPENITDPLDESYCYQIASGRADTLIVDARLVPALSALPATECFSIRGHIAAPIVLASGDIYGMLCAFSQIPRPDLDARDQAVVALLADLIAKDIDANQGPNRDPDLINVLSDALQDARFDAMLQPVYCLSAHDIIGYEMLTRFPDAPASTEQVFSAAAENDLAVRLDAAILRNAAKIAKQLRGDTFLAVNMSVASVTALDLTEIFDATCRDRIVLEITEHQAVTNYRSFAPVLKRLRGLGFRIAIDDVGAGYSSFRHVLQLRPDFIKLDRSLVSGIDMNHEQATLVSGLQQYASAHGGQIIAEGIETLEEMDRLSQIGICRGQGFVLAAPQPWQSVLDKAG
ncbi:EAL domain-containing protein [Sagittula sp. SSi028]|uniref:sensor domain-containing phosphodiesterase n=1 Tax=Sagittula sp. SSi028 TaxID=3400636 RepID=UPI003AF96D43